MRRQMHRRSRRQPDNLSREQLRPRERWAELPPPAPLPSWDKPNTDFYDVIQNAKMMVERMTKQRQAAVYQSNYSQWSVVVIDENEWPAKEPTVPGAEATVWLREQIELLGEDKVFDRFQGQYQTELEWWHKYSAGLVVHWPISDWHQLRMEHISQKVVFAHWVITHPIFDPIAC